MTDEARIFDAPHASDTALRRGIGELRATLLPAQDELRSSFLRLEAELGDDARDADADSGVRPAPWALVPAPHAPSPALVVAAQPAHPGQARRMPPWAVAASSALALACAAGLALLVTRAAPAPSPSLLDSALAQSGRAEAPASPEPKDGRSTPAASEANNEQVAPVAAPRALLRAAAPRRSEVAAADGPSEPATGVLNINSIPLSRVVLDGRPLGETPRVQISVSAGVHTVLFVHPEYGRIFREVRVDAGRSSLAAVRFTQSLSRAEDPPERAAQPSG